MKTGHWSQWQCELVPFGEWWGVPEVDGLADYDWRAEWDGQGNDGVRRQGIGPAPPVRSGAHLPYRALLCAIVKVAVDDLRNHKHGCREFENAVDYIWGSGRAVFEVQASAVGLDPGAVRRQMEHELLAFNNRRQMERELLARV